MENDDSGEWGSEFKVGKSGFGRIVTAETNRKENDAGERENNENSNAEIERKAKFGNGKGEVGMKGSHREGLSGMEYHFRRVRLNCGFSWRHETAFKKFILGRMADEL
jgi:hypothetical protein